MMRHWPPIQVSLLVPFRPDPDAPHRARLWDWLQRYWAYELPYAEVVTGDSRGEVFSKSAAVNAAARKAQGRIFVIIDSDVYLPGAVIRQCATDIDAALRRDQRLWFIPYRHLYRLTEPATEQVLASHPRYPLRFPSPPPGDEVGGTEGSAHGHRFGAMVQIVPRECFEAVEGWQERFVGWGSEDVVQVRVQDTLYGRHKTTDNDVLHLWHPRIGESFTDRMWAGQMSPRANEALASRYNQATYDPVRMRALVEDDLASRSAGFMQWIRGLLF
jgi:glycosyltransferase involved in cell wall biosynthesis